jgi:hypothetical protein
MTMQGFTATLWVGAEYDDQFKNPIGEEVIIESWKPTRDQAEEELQRLREKHGEGIGVIS